MPSLKKKAMGGAKVTKPKKVVPYYALHARALVQQIITGMGGHGRSLCTWVIHKAYASSVFRQVSGLERLRKEGTRLVWSSDAGFKPAAPGVF